VVDRIAERIIKPSYLGLIPSFISLGFFLLIMGIPGLILILSLIISAPLFGILALFGVISLIGLIFLLLILSIKMTSYELREDGIFIRRGIIAKKQILLLYKQIQDVTEYQTFLNRIFGLKELQLQTMTVSSAMAGRISNLTVGDADWMRATLLDAINKKSLAAQPAGDFKQTSVATDYQVDDSAANPYPLHFMRMAIIALVFSATVLTAIGITIMVSAKDPSKMFYQIITDAIDASVVIIFVLIVIPAGLFIQQYTFKYWLGVTSVTIKSGWLSTRKTIIEYAKVQDFIVSTNIFTRIIGLSAVLFETGSEVIITGDSQRQQQPNYRILALRTEDAGTMGTLLLKKLRLNYAANPTPLVADIPLSSSKALKKTLSAGMALFFLFLIPTIFIMLAVHGGLLITLLSIGAGVFFALILCILLYQIFYLKYYYYDASPDTLTIRKGVFGKQQIYLPFAKIQNVFVDQDIFDRIFGIYDVHLSTVGRASIAMCHIDGVTKENADKLMAILLRQVKQNIPGK
jgi:uncharacterized membrane protein YdbT with pleckstrin-like domain